MAEGKDEPVDIRNENRLRLRPWLLSRLKTGQVIGLEWSDKKEGIFRIPWNHGGKHDWTPDKGKIFKDWALHTGKFVDGVDEPNHAKWKTNLRCALHKAKDIEELKTKGRANDDRNPYRVYKFKKLKKKGGIPIPEVTDEADVERVNSGPVIPTFISTYASSSSSGSSHPFSSASNPSRPMSIESQPKSNASSLPTNSQNSKEGIMCSPYSDESSNQSQSMSESSRQYPEQGELDYTILKEIENLECGKLPSDLTDLSLEQLGSCLGSSDSLFHDPKLISGNKRNPLEQILDTNIPTTQDTPASIFDGQFDLSALDNYNVSTFNNVTATSQNIDNPVPVIKQDNVLLFTNHSNNTTHTASQFRSPESFTTTSSPSPYSDHTSPASQTSNENEGDSNNVHMASIPESPDMNTGPQQLHTKFSCSGLPYHRCNIRNKHEMYIELIYKNNVMNRWHVEDQKGCRLLYRSIPAEAEEQLDSAVKEVLYGAEASQRLSLEMPPWPPNIGNEIAIAKAKGILENADRGIVLECEKGSLYITRYCKTKVYSNSNFAKVIQRQQTPTRIKIFEYENDFVPSFHRFKKTRLDRPSPSVILFFGQQNVSEQQAEKVLVMVRVTSCTALESLACEAEEGEQSASIHISSPNAFDDFADQIKTQLVIKD